MSRLSVPLARALASAIASAIALVALAVSPCRLSAQPVVGSRPAITRIEWPLANALIFADSNRGTQLLVSPSREAVQIDRLFWIDLDPVAVDAWASRLAAIVGATGDPAPNASHLTARLAGRAGGEVIAARRRDGRRWKREVTLDFRPPRGEGFGIRISSDEAMRFGTALAYAASLSDVRQLQASASELVRVRPGDIVTAPRLLSAAPPRFPQIAWDPRVAGDVWIEFLVDRDGRAGFETMEVLYAAHRAFIEPTRSALAASTFAPATLNGSPVPMRMRFRQLFLREKD